jgi:hypothetical protein
MTRKHKRAGSILLLLAVGGLLVYLGLEQEWTIGPIAAHYIGLLLTVFGVLGVCGVNIWYGGPLDPHFDHDEDTQVRGQPKE